MREHWESDLQINSAFLDLKVDMISLVMFLDCQAIQSRVKLRLATRSISRRIPTLSTFSRIFFRRCCTRSPMMCLHSQTTTSPMRMIRLFRLQSDCCGDTQVEMK